MFTADVLAVRLFYLIRNTAIKLTKVPSEYIISPIKMSVSSEVKVHLSHQSYTAVLAFTAIFFPILTLRHSHCTILNDH